MTPFLSTLEVFSLTSSNWFDTMHLYGCETGVSSTKEISCFTLSCTQGLHRLLQTRVHTPLGVNLALPVAMTYLLSAVYLTVLLCHCQTLV